MTVLPQDFKTFEEYFRSRGPRWTPSPTYRRWKKLQAELQINHPNADIRRGDKGYDFWYGIFVDGRMVKKFQQSLNKTAAEIAANWR